MKKLMSIVLAVCLVAVLVIPASASEVLVSLKDMKLSVASPDGYDIITRDTDPKDPVFEKYNLKYEDFMKHMKDSSIYFDAVAPDGKGEIVVTMDDNDIENFKDMKDKELKSFSDPIKKELSNSGVDMQTYEVYAHPQMKFLKITWENKAGGDHALQFYTCHDHKAMNFTYHSYDGKVSKDEEKCMEAFVANINLDKLPMTYVDPVSGTELTMPEGWTRDPETEDETFSLAFTSLEDPTVSFLFASQDVYETLDKETKSQVKRSDMNISLYEPADAAEIFSVETSQVKKVTYNKMNYYGASQDIDFGEDGEKNLYTVHQIMQLDDGWMYFFQMGEPKGESFHKDLDPIMKSVKYAK